MPSVVEEEELRQREILRETLIYKTFHAMVENWSDEDRDGCEINRQILHELCNSYFLDIDRKKLFHGIEYADAHKRAAYTVKWIMRFRPVQTKGRPVSIDVLLANEQLAMLVAFKKLNIPIEKVEECIIEHLLYMLRFRHIDTNALAMSFYLLQKITGAPV